MSSLHNDMAAKPSSEPPRRGPWNQHEDEQLIAAAKLCSVGKWVEISQMIGHRTPKQCRERWYQNLKPDLNHNPITQQEGQFIEEMVDTIGRKWAEIARAMENRSDNAVKNWWNGGVNRRKRGEDKAASSAKIATLGPRTTGNKVQKKTGPRPHHQSDMPSHHHAFNHYSMSASLGGPHLPPISVPLPNRHYEGNHPSPCSAAPSLVSDHPSQYSPSPATSPAQYTAQYSHRSSIAYSRPSSSGYGAEPTVILPIPHNLSPISRPESYETKAPSSYHSLGPHSIASRDPSLILPPIQLPSSAQASTAFSPINGPSTENRPLPMPQMHMLNRPAPIMTSPLPDVLGRRLSAVSATTPTAPSPRERMSLTNLMD